MVSGLASKVDADANIATSFCSEECACMDASEK